jgi:hypothetical protein
MNNEQMHAAVLALPEPDLMLESRLEDGPGEGAAYKAGTVVRLIEQARAEERQRLLAALNQQRAGTVMSKYISLRECQAARHALEDAIARLEMSAPEAAPMASGAAGWATSAPVEGEWHWVTDGADVWPAIASKARAGGWTNEDTWEDFSREVVAWRHIPKPPHPTPRPTSAAPGHQP